jgi:hypothetical protein
MRHIPWLVRAAAIAVAALASAPSWAETRSFSFANFERVDVAAGTEVILRQGPFSVVAEQRDGNWKFYYFYYRFFCDSLCIIHNSWFYTFQL